MNDMMMPKRNILQQDFFPLHVYLQLWNTVSSKHINEGEGRVISTMLLANPPSPYFILYFFFLSFSLTTCNCTVQEKI